jgi:hypothetical protein
MSITQLKQERDFFNSNQPEWVTLYPGKFVLIKGEKLVSIFDSAENAVSEGLKRFGSESFLVRGVNEKEEAICIPALMFGLLSVA